MIQGAVCCLSIWGPWPKSTDNVPRIEKWGASVFGSYITMEVGPGEGGERGECQGYWTVGSLEQ